MQVTSLRLVDFRSYTVAEVAFGKGLTAVIGANGQGKTNLLESICVAAGAGSLRGASDAALIRHGADVGLIRCQALHDTGRDLLIDVEIARRRPNRSTINGQRATRIDLSEALNVTVFAPDDLALVKGEPAGRRRWIDTALSAVRPSSAGLRSDLDKILRQRNALLRQAGGRISVDISVTLDVWDSRLAAVGDELRKRRMALIEVMHDDLASSYACVSGQEGSAGIKYVSSWGSGPLQQALLDARDTDLRRGVTTVGPHRDDVSLWINGLPARTHASQGEQRSMTLAMRLSVDAVVRRSRNVHPVLLLDDVFSELDAARATALIEALPEGQKIITAAGELPVGIAPQRRILVEQGKLAVDQP